MSAPFANVQRIVLVGTHWKVAHHLALRFDKPAPCRFLALLSDRGCFPTPATRCKPDVQMSLGFTRRGLEHIYVPKHVLICFALKAPAFSAGAALRAARCLGLSGRNSPKHWEDQYSFQDLDAVISIHARSDEALAPRLKVIMECAADASIHVSQMGVAEKLMRAPANETFRSEDQWVHFGYRDGLSRIGIKGWTEKDKLKECRPFSIFESGEFVLGYPQNSGANPWIAGPGVRVWPQELRNFFRDGSFGVLQKIEQDVEAFEKFIASGVEANKAKAGGLDARLFRAKLCGRFPDGEPLAAATNASAEADFDYLGDPRGDLCPFGAHVRRMNPRISPVGQADPVAQAARVRPLLRRGMPYGPAWASEGSPAQKRGIFGQFFCASIEDQFEHLFAQWGDRVPMGSPDRGGARDPFFGAHEAGDGQFEIPIPGARSVMVDGFQTFTRTRGIAYLFYPSLSTLMTISKQSFWHVLEQGDE